MIFIKNMQSIRNCFTASKNNASILVAIIQTLNEKMYGYPLPEHINCSKPTIFEGFAKIESISGNHIVLNAIKDGGIYYIQIPAHPETGKSFFDARYKLVIYN